MRPGIKTKKARQGVAAVEMALCLPFIVICLAGIFETFRIIQVQQLLNNAAREGCRIASQGYYVNGGGTETNVTISNVIDGIKANLRSTWVVGFNPFLENSNFNAAKKYYDPIFNSMNITFTTFSSNGITPTSTLRQPHQLNKGEIFQVDISIPYSNIKYIYLDFGLLDLLTIKSSARMVCLLNKPLSGSVSMPNPRN